MSEEKKKREPIARVGDQPVVVELLDDRLRRVALTIGVMIIVAGAITAIALSWPVISMVLSTAMPFLVGLIFAYIFNPIVTFVQKRLKLSRVGGVLALYLIFLGVFVGFFAIVLPILITQIQSAYTGISQFATEQIGNLSEVIGVPEGHTMEEVQSASASVYMVLWEQITLWVDEAAIFSDLFNQATDSQHVRNAATSGFAVVGDALTFLFALINHTIGGIIFLVFAALVNIYLLLDFSKLRDVMGVVIPSEYRDRTFDLLEKLDIAVGGFIRGTLIVASLVGLLTFAGLWILGLRQYALLIGLIAGLGNLVPYLGPIMGFTPAALYILFSGVYDTTKERLIYLAGLVVLFSVIQTIESFIFQPKIVGKNAQLHPIAVLFALAFGANFGILGMILAVPIACIVRVLIKEFFWDRREEKWKTHTGKTTLGQWRKTNSQESVPKEKGEA